MSLNISPSRDKSLNIASPNNRPISPTKRVTSPIQTSKLFVSTGIKPPVISKPTKKQRPATAQPNGRLQHYKPDQRYNNASNNASKMRDRLSPQESEFFRTEAISELEKLGIEDEDSYKVNITL